MHKPAKSLHEVELKFSIPKNRVKEIESFLSSLKKKDALKISTTREISQADSYFDSSAFDLVQHHCSLRVREVKGQRLMTFKRSGTSKRAALNDRIQIEGIYGRNTLDRITRNTPWLLMLNNTTTTPAVARGKNIALHELGLYKILSLKNKRTIYEAKYTRDLKIELCIDHVQTGIGKGTRTFFELEAEYVSGDLGRMKDFERYLRSQFPWLRSSGSSKYERSLKSLRIWKRNRALNDEMAGRWRKRLNKVFKRFKTYYTLVLQFKDEEDLHSCRVALRQLITLLGFLADGQKSSQPLTKVSRKFAKIQKILGRLRDRDVYLIYAAIDPALQMDTEKIQLEFLDLVKLERDQQRLKALLRLPKYVNETLQKEWDVLMSRHLSKLVRNAHAEDQYSALISRFEDAHRALVHARTTFGPVHPITVKQLHKVRILVKQLRYASQYLAFALPGNTKLLVPGLADLQDRMGEINDIYNHIRHTRIIAGRFEKLIGLMIQPQIDRMQDELQTKLKEFEIGDFDELIGTHTAGSDKPVNVGSISSQSV